jgi:hypothetical protein
MTALNDLAGKKFSRLFVVCRAENKGKHVSWKCLCDCGSETVVSSTHLSSGHSKSCGCFSIEEKSKRKTNLVHGMEGTTEYRSWRAMKDRCYRKNNKKYHLYGGRGITVCDEWKNSFAEFFKHVGLKPSPKHTIDRIDNNHGYEVGNVRWATATEQNNNRRPQKKRKTSKPK